MSLVSIALDSILFLLLIFALWYGMRLERRLKELRNAYSGFATAVVDLDASAAKAQKALNDMRQTSESTQDLIHERVLTARELTAKLEVQVERAERVLAQLEKIPNFTTQMPMSGRKDPETLIDRPVTNLPERAPRVRATHGGGGGDLRRSRAKDQDEDLFSDGSPWDQVTRPSAQSPSAAQVQTHDQERRGPSSLEDTPSSQVPVEEDLFVSSRPGRIRPWAPESRQASALKSEAPKSRLGRARGQARSGDDG